jgi:hypothetical protein
VAVLWHSKKNFADFPLDERPEQLLRDQGYLRFLGRGRYRVRAVD